MGSILKKYYYIRPYNTPTTIHDICPICHGDFTKYDFIILDCKHAFHASCIFESLYNNHKKCPMCRNKIKYPYHRSRKNK